MQTARILFIRTDRMGDVLMNLPAVRVLRRAFPKAWITFIVDRSVSDLLQDHPDIDELMVVDIKKIKESLKSRWQFIQKIKKVKFDLAVVSNPDKFLHALTFLGGIPKRVGYRRKWGFLLTDTLVDNKAGANYHEIESNLKLASLVTDKKWDGRFCLPVDERAKNDIDLFIQRDCPGSGAIIAVHTGTSNPAKRWATDNFLKISELCGERGGFKVILIGGEEEREIAAEIQRRLGGHAVNWAGRTNLKQLAAFLSHSRVKALVSCDSGPVHVAWIAGTPVVAMYAKNVKGSDPVRWGPKDTQSEVIFKPMDEITPLEVYEALERVLAKGAKP